MKSLARRRRVAFSAVLALAVGAVAVGPMTAQGDSHVSSPGVPAYVALEDIDGVTRVAVYDDTDTVVGAPVTITVDKKCVVTNVPSIDDHLRLEVVDANGVATNDALQLVSSRVGTTQNGGPCSGNAARIADGQYFRISVGTELATQGYAFAGADLNIDTSQGNGLVVSIDGGIASTNNLVQGRLVVAPEDPFESLTLSLSGQGSFGVRSAGGPVGDRTTFDLVDVGILIDCGETVTVPGTASIDAVTFTREDNKDPRFCEPVRLRITFDADGTINAGSTNPSLAVGDVVTIDVPELDGTGQEVRATSSITWNVDRIDGTGVARSQTDLNDELTREVQYVDGVEPQLVTYCREVVDSDLSASFTAPDGQAWCLLSDDRNLAGDVIVQTITLVANGDPKFF